MKRCFKCGEVKPLSDFYKHKAMKDGHVNKCKSCNKLDVSKNRKEKLEYYRDYDRNRGMKPHRVEARKLYQSGEAGRKVVAEIKQRYTERNPIKRAAQIMVGNAVRDGRLLKPHSCESCGQSPKRIHGHHDDYAQPLVVRWLCPKCHKDWHKKNGEGANAH